MWLSMKKRVLRLGHYKFIQLAPKMKSQVLVREKKEHQDGESMENKAERDLKMLLYSLQRWTEVTGQERQRVQLQKQRKTRTDETGTLLEDSE